jgi:SAM-dependent methyltransferase
MPSAQPGTAEPRVVPYGRQTLDHPNTVARFAHLRRHRLSLALARRHVGHGGAILDVGAGTGAFLHELRMMRLDLKPTAFEPYMALGFPDIHRVTALADLPDRSFDAVSAFEVCEHLTPDKLEDLLGQAQRLLRPHGRLLVSVPIMEGLALPLKEASRAALFRRPSDYGWADLVRGVAGQPVRRPANMLTTHKGFSHRALWRRLERDFREIDARLSPFAALPWWMNSQRFGVFTPLRT